MHPKSCCALLLLAFVASRAAPSPKIINKSSITDAESDLANENFPVEDSGANKDRAKKSATTFCVDVRSEKEEEPKPFAIVQSVPAPAPMALVQSAPAPIPTSALTIVQPAQAPCPPESLSVNLVQPTPQTETVYVQTGPQPQLANLMVQSQPGLPQPASQIVVPAASPIPSQYQLNIVPSAVPQQTNYVVQSQPASQPIQTVRILQQQPPQSTVTLIQEPKLETEKSSIKALPMQLSEPNHRDMLQCNCRSDSHLKSRQSSNPNHQIITPSLLRSVPFDYYPLSVVPFNKLTTKTDPNVPTISIPKHTEPRHHKHKIYLDTLDYPIAYNYPGYTYSYPYSYSYPLGNYGFNSFYPYDQGYSYENSPTSIIVNAGEPFVGQAQSKNAHSEPNPIISQVGDLIKNQKRETNSVFQSTNSKQNEIQQQEQKSTIMDAVADTIKIGNTK